MPHIIKTLQNQPISSALSQLTEVHHLLARSVLSAYRDIDISYESLGGDFKRMFILLPPHSLIGKEKERFVELVNILATVEKTMDALHWLSCEFASPWVEICHPSTSDSHEGNDIVLLDKEGGGVMVRCEVTDVISSNAGQNGKELKDLRSLSCAKSVPDDGIRRFIATSPEFALALCSTKRKWSHKHYRYHPHDLNTDKRTVILEIKEGDRHVPI